MRARIELGNRSSIAHKVQAGRRDETSVEKESERRLAVQGNPCKIKRYKNKLPFSVRLKYTFALYEVR